MQVKETYLKFAAPLKKRSSTRKIVIHHSASRDVSAAEIHRWHLNRKWSGIGYHYVIRQDGTIERGRLEDVIGAHSGSQGNPDSIGICLTGNFSETLPGGMQMQSLVWLIGDIISRYGHLEVIGHSDIMPTECPGLLFPWYELRTMLAGDGGNVAEPWKIEIMDEARELGFITSEHGPDEPADKWFVLAVALNLFKRMSELDR